MSYTLKQCHIRVEQAVQKMGVFAYSDMLHEEIDLKLEESIQHLLEVVSNPDEHPEGFQGSQVALDDLREIHIKGEELTVASFDEGVIVDLSTTVSPYQHLIYSESRTSIVCNNAVQTRKVRNRKIKSEHLRDVLKSSLRGTNKESPVSELFQKTLRIYTFNYQGTKIFDIDRVFVDYLRVPKKLQYNTPGTDIISKDDLMQFPDQTMLKIIDYCIEKIFIIQEHKGTKISQFNQLRKQ